VSRDNPLPDRSTSAHRRSRRAALQDLGRGGLLAALGSAAAGKRGSAAAASVATPTLTTPDLIYLSATDARRLFAGKQLSPVEVLEAQIAQIEARNAEVNCITYTHFDKARAAARESERRYARGEARALEGITVGVKDDQLIAGKITTYGSVLFQDYRATESSPLVDKLAEAGAVVSIQTPVPEMMFHAATGSTLWGITRNPWNLRETPGGSSGGSAAALAAGFCTLATGSDMGGSIRIPASLCGLYGFKPPFGRVAPAPDAYDLVAAAEGPLARGFTDMALMQNAIAGPHPRSFVALRPKLDYPLTYPGIGGWVLAYDPTFMGEPDADYRSNTDAAIRRFVDLGVEVREVHLPWNVDDVADTLLEGGLLATSFGAGLEALLVAEDLLTPYARATAERARGLDARAAAAHFQTTMQEMYLDLRRLVFDAGCRALLVPTLRTTHVAADNDPETDTYRLNGQDLPGRGWFLTTPFNILNRCPVVNVPTGIAAENGVPTGLQIVADAYEDLDAFQIAAAYAGAAPRFFSGNLIPDYRNQP
jgi:Asp-tRNA(Asn)/Glu-tRNA(Gln) amidotransferase A subunit family amidase